MNKHRAKGHLDPDFLAADGTADVVCAICRRRHQEPSIHLPHGIHLSLCERHGSQSYLCADGGLRFVRTLTAIWSANGILNRQRTRALIAHVRMVRHALRARELPGSYAYRAERAEAERRLAAGDKLDAVIADIRAPHRWGTIPAPSERTIRRWYQQRRWMKPPIIETLRAITQPVLDALEVLAYMGTPGNFADWISLNGATPRGEQRLHDLRTHQRQRRHRGSRRPGR